MIRAQIRIRNNLPRVRQNFALAKNRIMSRTVISIQAVVQKRFSREAQALLRNLINVGSIQNDPLIGFFNAAQQLGTLQPWVPLAQSTIRRRQRRLAPGAPVSRHILVDTGELLNSITGQWDSGVDRGYIFPVGARNQFIAKIHEYGAPRARIPARPIFRDIAQAYFNNIIQLIRAGLTHYFRALSVQ